MHRGAGQGHGMAHQTISTTLTSMAYTGNLKVSTALRSGAKLCLSRVTQKSGRVQWHRAGPG